MADKPLAPAIQQALPDSPVLRTGTVVSVSVTGAVVTVGGGNVNAALVGGALGVYAGATVNLLQNGGQWLVLGGTSKTSQNPLILSGIYQSTTNNYVVGLNSTFGELYCNQAITGFMPLNHLCLVEFNLLIVNTAGTSVQTTVRVHRDTTGGAMFGQQICFQSLVSTTSPVKLQAWLIGDGTTRTFFMTGQVNTAGTITFQTNSLVPTPIFVADYGDASAIARQ